MIELDLLRDEINILDCKIIEIFQKRMDIVKKIAYIKKDNNLSIYSKDREIEIMNNIIKLSNEEYLNYNKKLFYLIFNLSKELQENV